jgi:hypothetical protein
MGRPPAEHRTDQPPAEHRTDQPPAEAACMGQPPAEPARAALEVQGMGLRHPGEATSTSPGTAARFALVPAAG